jgi:hypothetical protein
VCMRVLVQNSSEGVRGVNGGLARLRDMWSGRLSVIQGIIKHGPALPTRLAT